MGGNLANRAERTFSGNVCAACHQPDGKGAVGAGAYPPLAADKNLVSTEFMLTALLHGAETACRRSAA